MKVIISILFIALTIYSYIYDFQQKILYISVDTFNLLPGSDESVVISFGKNDNDFTSRVFDNFYIYSSGHLFDHDKNRSHDFLLEHNHDVEGTIVEMQINENSKTSQQQVFNEYAPADEFSFSKTVVPVRLAIQGKENLVSRSQAKRVLSSLDKFKIVFLDFADIDNIGQAFADEIFRVFARKHPDISISSINANESVERWITRAKNA